MSDKAKSLFEAYAAGKMSRRELLTKTAQLGVAFGAANLMLNKALQTYWLRISIGKPTKGKA